MNGWKKKSMSKRDKRKKKGLRETIWLLLFLFDVDVVVSFYQLPVLLTTTS